jgi:cell shape-determining protein MreD
VTRARVAAAVAAIVTALLLQATLVAPVCAPAAVSLPAVLVAAVALADGPATGMAFGFATGLTADLGSQHPAGVLALCWLAAGLLCGLGADRYRWRRDVVTAGLVSGVAGLTAGVLLVVVHRGGTLADVVTHAPVTLAGDVLLAVLVVPLVRRMLRADSLRAPHPVYTEIVLDGRRG